MYDGFVNMALRIPFIFTGRAILIGVSGAEDWAERGTFGGWRWKRRYEIGRCSTVSEAAFGVRVFPAHEKYIRLVSQEKFEPSLILWTCCASTGAHAEQD